MAAACALALAVAVAVRSPVVGAGAGVGAWVILVLGYGAADGGSAANGGLSAALSPVITNANLSLPYLAVAACCAAVVTVAIRPKRGLL
jgi:hypothetical protein